MHVNDLYPNKRGTATRNIEKSVRIATHRHVIDVVWACYIIEDVIEDGIGVSSTAYFHELGAKRILSFEPIERWQSCTCNRDTHVITDTQNILDEASKFVINSRKTLLFIDGQSTEERFKVLESLIRLSPTCIIEHDVEALLNDDVSQRKRVLERNGYTAFQYVDQNPETGLYVKEPNELFAHWVRW